MNVIMKGIPNSGSMKHKKLFDKLMSRKVELWHNKEITTNLIPPGTIRTTVRRNIWSKIL